MFDLGKGFVDISEGSSEISFLLVENYNYDHFLWSSDRIVRRSVST